MHPRIICLLIGVSVFQLSRAQVQQNDSSIYYLGKADSLNWYGKYVEMTDYAYKALSWSERHKQCCGVIRSLSLLGRIDYGMRNVTGAVKNFRRAYAMSDSCNCTEFKRKITSNLGAVMFEYYDKKSPHQDTAVELLKEALRLTEEAGTKNELSKIHSLLAEVYMVLNRHQAAILNHIQSAIKYAEMVNDTGYVAFAEIKLGKYYKDLKQYEQAEKHFRRALELHRMTQNPESIAMSLVNVASILNDQKKQGVYELMYERSVIKDSLFNQSVRSQIADLSVQYQLEKKERERLIALKDGEIQEERLKSNTRTIAALIATLVLVLVLVIWRINAMNIRRKQLELENRTKLQAEKERIARDLHDNVGGQLSFVLYALEDFSEEQAGEKHAVVEGVNQAVRGVIGNLRETIWAMNDDEMKCSDFADKLKLYTKNMFKYTTVKVSFHEVIEHDNTLNALVGLNMYRICQEAINNAFKHAKATELHLHMKAGLRWEVKITDNGQGFDAQQGFDSYGLENMKRRAKEAHLNLEIDSSVGIGTAITVIG